MNPKSALKWLIPGMVLVIALSCAGCTEQVGTGSLTTLPTASPAPTTTVSPAGTPGISGLQAQKDQASALAATIAGDIDVPNLSAAIDRGPNSTAFLTVVNQLRTFKANHSQLAYVYTVEQVNGSVRFILTANHSWPDDAPFLSLYPDAPMELKQPVTVPIGVGPYTDSWGTFISGFAPVNMSPDTRVVLVGVDIRA